ncbi:hypothetical protein WSS_A11773 [Rhodococcus opacus M213]|uniref:Endoribonuclease L-PSP/chorismate mutase-like domain-containing protein n=2 Tax=Rhodococcus opacus TaxID=37919 RepID=K8XP35_RHOOP|nr:hypothetical protein WSS_A11773 [Rhodococcus opacus M213]
MTDAQHIHQGKDIEMTDTYRTTPSNPQRWTARLAALGLQLPPVAAPAAAYTPALRTGNLVYTSGQLPLVDGSSAYTGKVGADTSSQEATAAARICTLNALAAIDALVGIDHIVKIVKVVGFVSSSPGFNGQPAILNGASELLVDIFGDDGTHARSAVGVAELPRNVPVEVEMIVEVRSA